MRLKTVRRAQMQAVADMIRDRTSRAVREFNSYKFKRVNANQVKVTSGSGNEYTVTKLKHSTVCTCKDFMERCVGTEVRCKHIMATTAWEQMNKPFDKQKFLKSVMDSDFPDY